MSQSSLGQNEANFHQRFNFKEKTNLHFDGFNAKINNFVNEIKLEVLFFALNNYSVLFYNQKNLKDNHFDRMKHGNNSKITDPKNF